MTRFLVSIRTKIFAVICGLAVGLVALLTTYFPVQHVAYIRHSLDQKARAYGQLLARAVEPAIAFDDRETAREIFHAAAADADVRGLGLFDRSGHALYVEGELAAQAIQVGAREGVTTQTFDGVVRCTVPVVSKEGPRGTLVVELSTRSVAVERGRILRTAAIVGVLAATIGLVAAWLTARSFGRRLRAIARVTTSVAAGSLVHPPLRDDSRDEIGQLARAFNEMVSKIARLMNDLSSTAADMRLVLDHVGEGFLTVDTAGTMSRERSAVVEAWLGPADETSAFGDYLAKVDPDAGLWFSLGFKAIVDDTLPLELAVEQLPKQIRSDGRLLRMRYKPILDEGRFRELLVVVSDVTSEFARLQAETSQREMMNLFERAMRDRAGLLEFLDEAGGLVGALASSSIDDAAARLRAVHTLKGTCSQFGLIRVAELCHEIESALVEPGDQVPAELWKELEARWLHVSATFRSLVGERQTAACEVDPREIERLRLAIVQGRARGELAEMVETMRLEPAERRLARIAEHAQALSARLDKPGLEVRVEGNGVRVDAQRWASFWSASVHLVRNAVDHGIEQPEERLARGKPSAGLLTLRTFRELESIVVELADDGRGIDWDAVEERARSAGLPHATREQLERALFDDGFSTRTEVTESSGRGVGLAAVRAACVALGGSIEVITERWRGTTFRFRLPRAKASARMPAVEAARDAVA